MSVPVPLSTHIFLIAVPLLIAAAAIVVYLVGANHEP